MPAGPPVTARHSISSHSGRGPSGTTDALGLAIYRDRDLSDPQVTSLQSHFVMRSGPDEVWLDGTSFGRNSRLWEDGPTGTSGSLSRP